MHDRRCRVGGWQSGRFGLQLLCLFFFLAGGAFAAELRERGCDGKIRVWHAHHLVGDAVGLVFERIIDSPNGNLWLQANARR